MDDAGDFARAFGDAFNAFLRSQNLTQSKAAEMMGLEPKKGKARLNTYCHDSPRGTRPKPDSEILYRICTVLGFTFEYQGFQIAASTLGRKQNKKKQNEQAEQLQIEFDGQINLTEKIGTVSIRVKRPPQRTDVELALRGSATKTRHSKRKGHPATG